MIKKEILIVSTVMGLFFTAAYFDWQPVKALMDWKAATNARATQAVSVSDYEVVDHSQGEEPFLTVDFLKGKHFWHPQVAIWLEDTSGNYMETLVVTTSTARGLFYSGRSAENFRDFDNAKSEEAKETTRVDALPVWSHKKCMKYPDGFYSPPPDHPLPDGITMATPSGNFYFKGQGPAINATAFRVMVEVNVAFDENEYYSEYDFVDDSLYHGGTGLLGQPSIVYSTIVHKRDKSNYYLMEKIGRGHHSGIDGLIYGDLNTLTTAHYIVERLVVGVSEKWYKR
jgi:hypothetical protein